MRDTASTEEHPRLELLYSARDSPHDNPAEQIWAALKNYVANTAVTWLGRSGQGRSCFSARPHDQTLATARLWTSPWLPPGLRTELLECRLESGFFAE